MTNRFVAALRWLYEQVREVVWPRIAAKLERTWETDMLRAILTLLAQIGPCPVDEIVESTSGWGTPLGPLQPYTRRQVVAALAYAKRRGYVQLYPLYPESALRWSITSAGLARLKEATRE